MLGLLGGGGASVSPAVLGLLGGGRSLCLTCSAWTARRRIRASVSPAVLGLLGGGGASVSPAVLGLLGGGGASVSPAVLGLLGGGGASVSPAVLGLLGGGGASVSPAVLGLLGGDGASVSPAVPGLLGGGGASVSPAVLGLLRGREGTSGFLVGSEGSFTKITLLRSLASSLGDFNNLACVGWGGGGDSRDLAKAAWLGREQPPSDRKTAATASTMIMRIFKHHRPVPLWKRSRVDDLSTAN